MTKERKPYPSDVTDDEWNFCVAYLTLMKEDAPQREHALRELFNGLRWLVRTGSPWRLMPALPSAMLPRRPVMPPLKRPTLSVMLLRMRLTLPSRRPTRLRKLWMLLRRSSNSWSGTGLSLLHRATG
jgi:transposase